MAHTASVAPAGSSMATPHVPTGDPGHVPTINQISRVFEKPPAGDHGYADSSGRGSGRVIRSAIGRLHDHGPCVPTGTSRKEVTASGPRETTRVRQHTGPRFICRVAVEEDEAI